MRKRQRERDRDMKRERDRDMKRERKIERQKGAEREWKSSNKESIKVGLFYLSIPQLSFSFKLIIGNLVFVLKPIIKRWNCFIKNFKLKAHFWLKKKKIMNLLILIRLYII